MKIPSELCSELTITLEDTSNGRSDSRSDSRGDSSCDLVKTFQEIEKRYWTYLDSYVALQKYPSLTFEQFVSAIYQICGGNVCNVREHMRMYSSYKKSLPTAGIIYYHIGVNEISFVVIQVKAVPGHAEPVWSMPKGKAEPGESLCETAMREFREETGISVDIPPGNSACNVAKSTFYFHRVEHKTETFSGYNGREIKAVRWTTVNDVQANPQRYSKQVLGVARSLLSRFGYHSFHSRQSMI